MKSDLQNASMLIKYLDRDTNRQVMLALNADVIEVAFPANAELPSIEVNVNTDAIIVDSNGKRLAMYEFSDIVAEAGSE